MPYIIQHSGEAALLLDDFIFHKHATVLNICI